MRGAEGCPLGPEDRLLELASPPLYTPFPNPYVHRFISSSPHLSVSSSRTYSREPMAADISEGRTDPAYLAQSYHTKVPYRAIVRYLEHFTDPGDLVLDGFCGSGMVGVAANQTARRAILCDLSPAATFLAHSFCHPIDLDEAVTAFDRLLQQLGEECGWLYSSLGREIDYVIWSEIFLCPMCGVGFPFSEAGFDFQRRRPRPQVSCPSCGATLRANDLERSLDEDGRTREAPVRVAYTGNHSPRETSPDLGFLDLQREIERRPIPYPYPDNPMMNRRDSRGGWGDMWRRGYHSGMNRVSDFYFKRTLWALAAAVDLVRRSGASPPAKQLMLQVIVNSSTSLTRMRRAYQSVLPLVLYVPKVRRETNVLHSLRSRFNATVACLGQLRRSDSVLITTQSTTSLFNIPDSCVDYIFTDPPFGDNIRYSEVNFLWEAWLGAFTNQGPEAIISPGQAKGVREYQELMRRCFAEMHRVLKPDHWMTVAFHNSDSRVWNAIQQALQDAGFEVADVRLLDKRQISFKQASANTVRRDLVISACKAGATRPSQGDAGRGDRETGGSGDAESAWDSVRERLSELPIPVPGDGKTPEVSERGALALFNYMVASHLRRHLPVPLDAQQFCAELSLRFEQRDGIYLLPEQAAEYDRIVATSGRKI